MLKFIKCFIVVFFLALVSLFPVNPVTANPMLVEPSIAHKAPVLQTHGINKLFMELGITPPIHGFANPCMDLEQYTIKYCTPFTIRDIVEKGFFSGSEKQYFEQIKMDKNVCILTGEYIGRVCESGNLMKILYHFSNEK